MRQNHRFIAGFIRWWNGDHSPFTYPNYLLVNEDPDVSYLRMSLRRNFVVSSLLGLLFLIFGQVVWADRYWPIFLTLFILAFFVVPLAEEPATFLWYTAILGWLGILNTIHQFSTIPVFIRIFWVAVIGLQVWGVYQSVKTYHRFQYLYRVYSVDGMGISYQLRRGWSGSLVLVIISVSLTSLLFAPINLGQGMTDALTRLAIYTTAVSPALALASLGNPETPKLPGRIAFALSVLYALAVLVFIVSNRLA